MYICNVYVQVFFYCLDTNIVVVITCIVNSCSQLSFQYLISNYICSILLFGPSFHRTKWPLSHPFVFPDVHPPLEPLLPLNQVKKMTTELMLRRHSRNGPCSCFRYMYNTLSILSNNTSKYSSTCSLHVSDCLHLCVLDDIRTLYYRVHHFYFSLLKDLNAVISSSCVVDITKKEGQL